MSTDLSPPVTHLSPLPVTPQGQAVSPLPGHLAAAVADLQHHSKSAATRRAWVSDWRRWSSWCAAQGLCPLPATPDTVSAYLADQAQVVRVSTLRRHLATVSKAHQVAGAPNPCKTAGVLDTLAGVQRRYGCAPDEAPGLLPAGVRAVLDTLGGDLAGLRDRALLLVGWCAALRRSELAQLCWGDLRSDPGGLLLVLRRSKTDQGGAGRLVPLARDADLGVCPVAALERWRDAVAHERGAGVADSAPVFVQVSRWGHLGAALSGAAVAQVVQRRTAQAGLLERYRGHSLRKGAVQAAYQAGVTDSRVMSTTGHSSVAMLRRYQGQVGLVEQCATRGLLS